MLFSPSMTLNTRKTQHLFSFPTFFPKYFTIPLMWDSVAMHQRIHEFLRPAPIGILSAHELSLQCKVYCVECCVTLSSWSPQRQCSRLQHVNTHTQKNTFRYHTWMHTLDARMLKHCTWMHMSFCARSFNPPKHNPPLTHTQTHTV